MYYFVPGGNYHAFENINSDIEHTSIISMQVLEKKWKENKQ